LTIFLFINKFLFHRACEYHIVVSWENFPLDLWETQHNFCSVSKMSENFLSEKILCVEKFNQENKTHSYTQHPLLLFSQSFLLNKNSLKKVPTLKISHPAMRKKIKIVCGKIAKKEKKSVHKKPVKFTSIATENFLCWF